MPLARGAPLRFIAMNGIGAAAVGVFALLLGLGFLSAPSGIVPEVLAIMFVLASAWCGLLLLFFRDPDRGTGNGVVSAADGKVREARASGNGAAVSVFLGLFNVHVVRAPIAGRITTLAYKPGGKRFAFSKDSHLNERLLVGIAGAGESCSLTLIAGAFADRIVSYVEPGAAVEKGARIGLIKFGSRVDLDFSANSPLELRVEVGDTVIAGQTSILGPAGEARSS